MSEAPTTGHNQGPTFADRIADQLADLNDWLAVENLRILDRAEQLAEASTRVPEKCEDDDTAEKMADMVKALNVCAKALEDARKTNKAPILEAGRQLDGFFARPREKLEAMSKDIRSRMDGYLRRKAEAERKRREAEARDAAAKARLAEEAMNTEDELTQAIEAGAEADRARKAAAAKAADLGRSRGETGALASLRTTWDFEITGAVDLEALRKHIPQDAIERAIRAYIKADGRELGGVRIFQITSTVVR